MAYALNINKTGKYNQWKPPLLYQYDEPAGWRRLLQGPYRCKECLNASPGNALEQANITFFPVLSKWTYYNSLIRLNDK
jgi:hypothetical protein